MHPLVTQLIFTREEFRRVWTDVDSAEGERSLSPFNSLSFIVAHVATHEHSLWLRRAQNRTLPSALLRLRAGAEPEAPPWDAATAIWTQVTAESLPYLETITDATLDARFARDAQRPAEPAIGHHLMRLIYHYWFHIGEMHGIRQALGHTDIPEFVGPVEQTRYR